MRRTLTADPPSADADATSTWRVSQVYGDGKALLDQLREVAALLEEGFNAAGRSQKDLTNGLVQKVRLERAVARRPRPSRRRSVVDPISSNRRPSVRPSVHLDPPLLTRASPIDPQVRWSGGNFVCLVADDGVDGSELVGACDLTLLPASGPKRSREGLVDRVPSRLELNDADDFLYLTGMVVPPRMRRRGIARALLKRAEALAPKMRGDGKDAPPVCIALHVSADNASARALYESAGYVEVAEEGAAKEREGGWSFPGFGGRGGSAGNGVLMVKRLASLTSS